MQNELIDNFKNHMRKGLIVLFLVSLSCQLMAQKQKQNWYFGRSAAISFESGVPVVKNDNLISTYGVASACISDKVTGKLLFYSNGKEVRDGKHQLAIGGADLGSGSAVNDVLILEDLFASNEYYLFIVLPTSIRYFSVSVATDGTCTVSSNFKELVRGNFNKATAVKNCRTGGYWFITFDLQTQNFYSFSLAANGVQADATVTSANSSGITLTRLGDMVSNHLGSQIALSNYSMDEPHTLLFDIDKTCGTLSFYKSLNANNDEYAYGLAYSPNNKYLYITYSVAESTLWQYDIDNGMALLIARSNSNLNEMQMGSDGKIYISTHTNGIPGPLIDVINKPNKVSLTCDYQKAALDLGTGANSSFHLPNFIQDYSENTCQDMIPEFSLSNICLGDTLRVKQSNNFMPKADFWWQFGLDSIQTIEPEFYFTEAGSKEISFNWEVCNELDSMNYTVMVRDLPKVNLPSDTTVCYQDTFELSAWPIVRAQYTWQPDMGNSNTATIYEPGKYTLTVNNGCKAVASTQVHYLEPIWTQLGEEYFICEELDELVILDAGKGFDSYRWFPTKDTTQWINVAKVDSYFVIVEDYRGCKTEGGTAVKRRCPIYLYFPNSFSPNADGLNDFFKPIGQDVNFYQLSIYNRWGELIFTSDQLEKGWDGTFKGVKSPEDIYVYMCEYQGIDEQKIKRKFYKQGRITLVR